MTKEFKPGLYVNDEYYGERIAQARARARHLANTLPGEMDVIRQTEDELFIVETHRPGNNMTLVTPQPKIYKPASEVATRQYFTADQREGEGEGRS